MASSRSPSSPSQTQVKRRLPTKPVSGARAYLGIDGLDETLGFTSVAFLPLLPRGHMWLRKTTPCRGQIDLESAVDCSLPRLLCPIHAGRSTPELTWKHVSSGFAIGP